MFFRMSASVILLLLTSSFAIAQTDNAKQAHNESRESSDSFQPIFNGKNLNGWKVFVDPKAKSVPENQWRVEQGQLVCKAGPKGYLATEKEYGDFIVRFQWKWGKETLKKNRYSSMFVRVTGPDKIWPKGVDITLGAGSAGQFWIVGGFELAVDSKRQDTKNKIHFFAIKTDADKPIGQWNQCKITCKGGTIQSEINGHLVNKGTGASSKKGRLILLSEGAEIHFRQMEIRELK